MGKIAYYPRQLSNGLNVLYFVKAIYIKEKDLHDYFGIPINEITGWITGDLIQTDFVHISKERWVDVRTINSFFLQKYKVPTWYVLTSPYMDGKGMMDERCYQLTNLYLTMQQKLRGNKLNQNLIKVVKVELPRMQSIAVSEVMFSYLKSLNTITNLEKFLLYYKFCKDMTNSTKPSFFTNSFDVFRNKYNRFCKKGIESFIHANFYNSYALKPFTINEEKFILESFGNGAKCRFRQITRDLNTERVRLGLKTVSVNKLIDFVRNHPEYGERCLQREGTEGVEKRMMHPNRLGTFEPGNVYQIDGARFNVPYLNDENEVKLLVLVAMIDVFSLKIVACCLATTESFESYEKIIIDSIKLTGFLPREMVTDNLPSLKSERGLYFFRKLELMGVGVRQHTKMVPQDKAQIENFFKIFPELYLKKVNGYLGDDIKSRDRNGKPNRDLLIQARKKSNLRSRKELEELLIDRISSYNTTYKHRNSTPDELFKNTIPKNSIIVSDKFKPILTYKEKNWTVNKTGFQFMHQGTMYQYPISVEHTHLFLKYMEKQLLVRFSEDNFNDIFIYENEFADDYLFKLRLHEPLPLAAVDRSKEHEVKWDIYNRRNGSVKKALLKVSKPSVLKIKSIENLIPGFDDKDLTKQIEDSFILKEDEKGIKKQKGLTFNIKGSCKII
ncbi:transposase family protein [Pedobacter psychrotolerans]|uniref:integrase catalytic domain-containing protein n=1 Tax=Pedobacter psychrotolerans TaxID=1843235 RepID=UPI003F9B8580